MRALAALAALSGALVQRAEALVRPDVLVQRCQVGDALIKSLGASVRQAPAGLSRLSMSGAAQLRGGASKARRPPAKGALAAPRMSLVARAWGGYLQSLEDRPIRTKMATSAVLAALGDVIAQTLDPSTAVFSVRRLLVLVSVNIVYFTPLLHYWYAFFDAVVGKLKLRPGTWRSAFTYLALDQLVNSPITLVGFFHVFALFAAISQAVLGAPMVGAGELLASVRAKIGAEYWNTLVANWKVWAAPQLLNFMFVPPPLRVGFANLIAVLWNAILSVIANR